MKYLIASDIHGSWDFCRLMLEAYEIERADRMILLGDILYHGPRNDLPSGYLPKKVLAALNERKKDILICMRGNCDAEVDEMVLDFPLYPGYLRAELNGKCFYLTHGHIYNAEDGGAGLPKGLESGDILLHGHTHIPLAGVCREGGRSFFLLNPGSVSIPKGGYANSFALLDDDMIFTVRDFDGGTIKSADLRQELS